MKASSFTLLSALSLGIFPACTGDEDTDEDRAEGPSEDDKDPQEATEEDARITPEVIEDPYTGIEDPGTGIRPISPDALGLCRLESPDASKKDCSDFVGRDVDDLPPGDYVLLARLDVPRDSKKWPVRFTTWCTRIGSEKERKERTSEGTVSAGSKELGYRFWALSFNVPETAGWASDCTWKLSAPHPEGDNEFVGSWSFTATPEESR
jgi:hypothetical protein